MSLAESTFYVTGGTLRQDAPSYVQRCADAELLDGLLKGEFCYVLTSRQMGKSSLMVRTAGKLREQGIHVVVLDLTAIGQNLSPEQWYDGLLVRVGRQLRLEEELEQFWEAHRKLGPCDRFFTAIREVALPKLSASSVQSSAEQPNTEPSPLKTGRMVIFVDELDVVRSLPFSSDEFFAAIRECYTRRTEDPVVTRLAFCLLGVATPSDLIRDTRVTPFNIGRRIELNDFTPAEAAPLANGLQPEHSQLSTFNSQLLLDRILYWTNGHPYLTQRLCQAIAADAESCSPERVDRMCEALFFAARAREQDDNLLFVRERLLRSDADLATLLHFYERVLARKRVQDDETNPLVSALRLSGVTRSRKGCLEGRNRIYERVFDRHWIHANMPNAEVRRQRAAFIKGMIRTAGLALVVVAIVVSLAVSARRQADRAERSLYGADMILAQQALDASNLGEARQFLGRYRPSYSRLGLGFSKNDLRGWEWRYLWTLSRSDELATLGNQPGVLGPVGYVAFSPDGHTLASGGHTVRLWKLESPGQFETLPHPEGSPDGGALAYSPSGLMLATVTGDGTVRIWDVARKQVTQTITNAAPISSLRFSPDGKLLAVGPEQGPVKLWEVQNWREIARLPTQNFQMLSVGMAFTADSKTFAYSRANGSIVLWDVPARSPITTLTGHTAAAMSLQFSRDGSILVSAAYEPDNSVKAWNVPDRKLITNVATFGSWVGSVAISPDEKFVAAASADQKIKFFEVATWKEVATLKGHLDEVWSIAFSPDGKTLASGGKDKTVRLWSGVPKPRDVNYMPVPSDLQSIRLSPQGDALLFAFVHGAPRVYHGATLKDIGQHPLPFSADAYLAISPGGQLLAAGETNGAITVWDAVRQVDVAILRPETRTVHRLVFSPDGRMLAAAGADGRIELWDVATSNRFAVFVTRHDGQGTKMRFSHDGTMLGVCGGPDYYAAEIWSISRREKVADLIGHEAAVNDVDLTGDKQTAATASWDGTLKLWDVETRKELASFHGQLRGYRCVAISPDDRRVAAGGSDGTIEIWDMNTRRAVAKLRGHKGHVLRAAFLPDNNTLVSVGDDGVRVWRALSLKQIDTEEKPKPYQK